MSVYTHTLSSSFALNIPVSVSFGELLLIGSILAGCVVIGLELVFEWVYK